MTAQIPLTAAEARAEAQRLRGLLSIIPVDAEFTEYAADTHVQAVHTPEGKTLRFVPHSLALAHIALLEQHALRLEREQGWVSVEEHLPEDGQRVLFTDIGGGIHAGRRHIDGWDEPVDFWDEGEVTHWQPLPAPPAKASAEAEAEGGGA